METNLSKKRELIKQISKASDMVPFSDFLLEFMDSYGLNNLRESTVEQLEVYQQQKHHSVIRIGTAKVSFLIYKSCGKEEAKWQQS